jgi:hypothetical protein
MEGYMMSRSEAERRGRCPPHRARRSAIALAGDILVEARIVGLRRLAQQTARGEVPAPDF